ncbi:MAG TPA: ABC transporter permease [Planctomycetota bacterium]|nr:ABC transporter permease [Planctomycetota bacterium]
MRTRLPALGPAQRVLGVLLVTAAVHAACFILIRIAPGGPFDDEVRLDPAVRAALVADLGGPEIDFRSWWTSLSGLLRGDLGPSMSLRDFEAADVLREGAARSLILGLRALSVAVLVGVALGVVSARTAGSAVDRALRTVGDVVLAVPAFAWCAVFLAGFALHLRAAPAAGAADGGLVLPAIVAAATPAVTIARLVRDELVTILASDSLRAAEARGVGGAARLWIHALPAASIPAAAYLGPAAASLLTGTLVVESIFGLAGLGTHLVQAALSRDYPVMSGAVLAYTLALSAANALADWAYGILDPRMSTS